MEAFADYRGVLLAFATATVLALFATPVVARLAAAIGAIDDPGDERRIHSVPTPRLGGVAIMAAALVATLMFLEWNLPPGQRLLQLEQTIATLMGAVMITILGAIDDMRSLGWRQKLAGQVGIATMVVLVPLVGERTSGLSQLLLVVRRIDPPLLEPFNIPDLLGVGLAVLFIVALMNVVNFIDGVDGLAAGVCAISAATFAVVAASYGRLNVAVLAAATCGAAIGFLRHNFLPGRARIFMGDSGSMLLGYLLAVIAIQGVLKTAAAISLVIPLALLAVPLFDSMFVVAKRLKYGVSPSHADRWHLHHRALNVGYTPRRVTALFWAWTASMSGVALALRFVDYGNSRAWKPEGLVVVGGFVLVAAALSAYLVVTLEIVKSRSVRRRNAERAAAVAAERHAEEARLAGEAAAGNGDALAVVNADPEAQARHAADAAVDPDGVAARPQSAAPAEPPVEPLP